MPYIGYVSNLPAGGRVLYWVGGTGTWNSTPGTKWALTSGGVGGEPVPTSLDDVYFDGNSSAPSPFPDTCTLSSTSVCRSASFVLYPGILSQGNVTWTIHGGLIMGAFMTYTLTTVSDSNNIDFAATSGAWYISTAGQTMSNYTFNGVGGTWLFFDEQTLGRRIYLESGTLYTADNDVTALAVDGSGTLARGLYLGSSTLNLSSGAGFPFWEFTTVTNLTFDAGTSTINAVNGSSGLRDFAGGSMTYNNVAIQSSTDFQLATITGANTFNNLSVDQNFAAPSELRFYSDQTINDTLTVNGRDASFRTMLSSDSFGTARILTAATVSFSNVDFRDITAGGAANWDLSSITGRSGDCFGNTGITFSTARNVYWFKDTGNYTSTTQWFTATAGGGSLATCPIPQDTGYFDSSSFSAGSEAINAIQGDNTVELRLGTLVWTGSTNIPEFAMGSIENYGSFTGISAMTYTGSVGGFFRWQNRDARTFTSGAVTWPLSYGVVVNCTAAGSVTQQDNFRTSNNFDAVTGLWDAGNNTLRASSVTVGTSGNAGSLTTGSGLLTSDSSFSHEGGVLTVGSGGLTTTTFNSTSGVRTINMGSGTWTLTSTGVVWNMSATDLTLNSDTSTIACTNTSTSTKTFEGVGQTYYNLTVSGAASAATFTIQNSNTFNNLTFNPLSNIRLTASTTQTVNGACTATGTAGNTIVVRSTSATNATISSTNNVTWDYVTLTDLTGAGAGVFSATNSTDGGGNVNWTITP